MHFIRNADSEAFEKIPRTTHPLPIQASSQLPLLHIETGSVLEVSAISTVGSNPEHLTYGSTAYDHVYRGGDDYRDRWEASASTRAYDTRTPEYPLGPAFSQSPPPYGQCGSLDRPIPGFRAWGTIYTDDARMKLGDGIRRQCFNCRATEMAKTWRRSKLSPGKMVRSRIVFEIRLHNIIPGLQ